MCSCRGPYGPRYGFARPVACWPNATHLTFRLLIWDSRSEASMKSSHRFRLAAVIAAMLAVPSIGGTAGAEESATVPTDPGFRAGTGQINPGVHEPLPSQSGEVTNIPTPEEARRALLTPISKQPSAGDAPGGPRLEAQTVGGANTKQESQNAIGGP